MSNYFNNSYFLSLYYCIICLLPKYDSSYLGPIAAYYYKLEGGGKLFCPLIPNYIYGPVYPLFYNILLPLT